MDLEALKTHLIDEEKRLNARFIKPYRPTDPNHGPNDFGHDVKAYLLLFHAAFEEFAESLSELMLSKVESDFLNKKITISTICLIAAHKISLDLPDADADVDKSCFDHIRLIIDSAKRLHSKLIKENHGVSPKYLRWLLLPVGINMPRGPEIDGLKKLAEARGSFAHTTAKLAHYGDYKKANNPMTPELAENTVADCLKIANDICESAKVVW